MSVECRAWRAKWKCIVSRVSCGKCIVSEPGVVSGKCRVWDGKCREESVESGVESVGSMKCGVRSAEPGTQKVERGV